jgi:hypothetical protein
MYVLEESNCAIVPMKLTNKEDNTSAEPAEGRARTKENDAQPHTHPTQGGARVSQGLGGVRQKARASKQERFTALLHHLTIDLLRESYFALQRSAAPGVDGVNWQQYEQRLEARLAELHDRVHRGAYRAQASRRVYIPKADGRQRPLGIASLEDKIVQLAIAVPTVTGPFTHDNVTHTVTFRLSPGSPVPRFPQVPPGSVPRFRPSTPRGTLQDAPATR